jgi:hypothetical protein
MICRRSQGTATGRTVKEEPAVSDHAGSDEASKKWKLFDADLESTRRARYASTSSPTSAAGKSTIRIRRHFSGW